MYQKFHFQGDHKHGKPGKLGEFVKLLKSQGKLRGILIFEEKNPKNSGKMKNMGHDRQQKYISFNFPLLSCSGKKFKMP